MRVHVWAPEFTAFGYGIAAFSRALALGLVDFGDDVRLFAKMDVPGTWQGCPHWGAGRLPPWLRTGAFGTVATWSCGKHRPDHLISTHVNFGPAANWARRCFGTPFTLVAHGVDVHEGLSPARIAALRAATRVIAVSAWTRQRLLNLAGIDPGRVAILPNTVDDARFAVSAGSQGLASRYNLKTDEKVLLSVGRLAVAEGYKGHDRIIEALPAIAAACGPVRFLLIGSGADRTRLELLARAHGVEHRLTFTGFVPDEELAAHYRLADVFAMPSTGEGFGVVFLEAMSCGTPVLAGNRDGSVDALDSGRLGSLVDPTDVRAIENGIIALLKKQGPPLWFDREALHAAVSRRFGRKAFQDTLRQVLVS